MSSFFFLKKKDIQEKLSKILDNLLQLEPHEYSKLERIRSESIQKLKSECWTESEIKAKTYDILMNEYMSYVNERLLSDKRLEQVSPGIGKLLSEHSRAVLIVKQTQQELDSAFNCHIETFTQKLKRDYSIRSRVSEWLNECVQNEKEKYQKANKYQVHEEAIKRCRDEKLMQAAYFIERDLLFCRDVRF